MTILKFGGVYMCGINGFNFLDNMLIQKMNDVIKHRGPDDSGIFADNNVTLGHQRLSIIDLSSAGHQLDCTPPTRHFYRKIRLAI